MFSNVEKVVLQALLTRETGTKAWDPGSSKEIEKTCVKKRVSKPKTDTTKMTQKVVSK